MLPCPPYVSVSPVVALFVIGMLMLPAAAFAQRGTGELRLQITDVTGATIAATGRLESAATGVRRSFATDAGGVWVAQDLPFGIYRLEAGGAGFAPFAASIDVRSEVPIA